MREGVDLKAWRGQRYPGRVKGLDLPKEFLADFTGEQLTRPAFWERLMEKSPEAFQEVASRFVEIVSRILREILPEYRTEPFVRDLKGLRDQVADMLARYEREAAPPEVRKGRRLDRVREALAERASTAAAKEADPVWRLRQRFRNKLVPPKGETEDWAIPFPYRGKRGSSSSLPADTALLEVDDAMGWKRGTATMEDLKRILTGPYKGPAREEPTAAAERAMERGSILERMHQVLAEGKDGEAEFSRRLPAGELRRASDQELERVHDEALNAGRVAESDRILAEIRERARLRERGIPRTRAEFEAAAERPPLMERLRARRAGTRAGSPPTGERRVGDALAEELYRKPFNDLTDAEAGDIETEAQARGFDAYAPLTPETERSLFALRAGGNQDRVVGAAGGAETPGFLQRLRAGRAGEGEVARAAAERPPLLERLHAQRAAESKGAPAIGEAARTVSGEPEAGFSRRRRREWPEPAEPDRFVAAASGSRNLGEIGEDAAREVGRSAGPIRLPREADSHIDERHRVQLAEAGYRGRFGRRRFVREVADSYDEIYRGPEGRLILAKRTPGTSVAYVELAPDFTGDYWSVRTAFVSNRTFLKNKPLLWERARGVRPSPAELTTPEFTGSPGAFSGQSNSSTENIAPEGPRVKGPGEDVGFSRWRNTEEPAPIWYSKLERAIEERMPASASADQVRGILRSAGVKPEEVEWSDLEGYLAGHPKVTKTEVLDHVRGNQVEVHEVWKGPQGTTSLLSPEERQELAALHWREHHLGGRLSAAEWNRIEDLETRNYAPVKSGQAKFGGYTLPGGERYRELLLTMPRAGESKGTRADLVKALERAGVGRFDAEREADNLERAWGNEHWHRDDLEPQAKGVLAKARALGVEPEANAHIEAVLADRGQSYRSPHWDEPNVLAHVRFTDRVDKDGKRVLFVEEIQSDWHQQGRERGYRMTALPQGYRVEPVTEGEVGGYVVRAASGEAIDQGKTPEEASQRAIEFLNGQGPDRNIYGGRIPNAPFKKTWPEFAFKRVLRYAAENGYDRVAWTTGEQQAERYDLSKQIARVTFDDNSTGGRGLPDLQGPPKSGVLTAVDSQGREVISERVEPGEVENYIGKDAARKLFEREARAADHAGLGVRRREISGLDLKVGGEGMRGFYDAILPSTVNKIVKRWGARVGEAEIPVSNAPGLEKYEVRYDTATGWEVFDKETRRRVRKAHSREEAQEIARTYGAKMRGVVVHSIDITPAMRESVLGEGQALFSRRRRPEGPAPDEAMRRRARAVGVTDEAIAALTPAQREVLLNKLEGHEAAKRDLWAPDEARARRDEELRLEADRQEREAAPGVPPGGDQRDLFESDEARARMAGRPNMTGKTAKVLGPHPYDFAPPLAAGREPLITGRPDNSGFAEIAKRFGRGTARAARMAVEMGKTGEMFLRGEAGRVGEEFYQRQERAAAKGRHWATVQRDAMVVAYRALKHLDKAWVKKHFMQAFEERKPMLNARVQAFADAWRKAETWLGEKAEEDEVETLGDWKHEEPALFRKHDPETYVPHIATEEAFEALTRMSGPLYLAMADYARMKGKPVDQIWKLAGPKFAIKRQGSLEYRRLMENAPWTISANGKTYKLIETDPSVLFEHVNSFTRRLALIEEFGRAGAEERTYLTEVVQRLIGAGAKPEEAQDFVVRMWNRLQGAREQDDALSGGRSGKALNLLNSVTAGLNLTGATVSNLFGGWHPIFTRYGMKNGAEGMWHAATHRIFGEGERGLRMIADLNSEVARNFAVTEDLEGRVGKATRGILKGLGFELVNAKINQATAFAAVRDLAERLDAIRGGDTGSLRHLWGQDEGAARRYLEREAGFSHEDVERMVEKGPTDLDVARYAMKAIEQVNAVGETPAGRSRFVSHPIARYLVAYSTWQRKMGRTLVYAVQEAGEGNVRPLLALLFYSPVAGAAVTAANNWLKDRESEDKSFAAKLLNAMFQGGAFGMLSRLQYSLSVSGRYGFSFLGTLFGPPQADVLEGFVDAVVKGARTASVRPLWDFLVRQAPAATIVERQVGKYDPDALARRLAHIVYLSHGTDRKGREHFPLDPIEDKTPNTARMLLARWRAMGRSDDELLERIHDAKVNREGALR